MAITLRNTKGSALTHTELDGNFTDLNNRVTTLEGATDNDSQTLALVGSDLSITGGNTVSLSSIGGISLTDLSVGSDGSPSSNGSVAYDNTTGIFTYTPPDLSTYLTSANSIDDMTDTDAKVSDIIGAKSVSNLSDVNFGSVVLDASNGENSILAWDQTAEAFVPETLQDLDIVTSVTAPTASIGASGDRAGTVAFDSSYMYYCTADYDGVANIWKRVAWSSDTWPV